MKVRAYLNHKIEKLNPTYEAVIFLDEKRIGFEDNDFFEARDMVRKMAKFFKLKRSTNNYQYEFVGEI